jgi:hypothetical protein
MAVNHCEDCAPEFPECWNDGSKCRKKPKPTTGPQSAKWYECAVCGYSVQQTTNHWGETYGFGNYNQCPDCPPFKRPTVWKCKEQPPEGFRLPEPWRRATIQVQLKNDNDNETERPTEGGGAIDR